MTTRSYRDQATYYRAALLLGLVDGTEVIAWADDILHHDPRPPHEVTDLALVPPLDLSAVRFALQPMADERESPEILRAILGVVLRDLGDGRRSVADTVRVLSQMARELAVPESMHWEIDALVDDHMLAKAGVTKDLGDSEERVREWLKRFPA